MYRSSRRRRGAVIAWAVLALGLSAGPAVAGEDFTRGDANVDGKIDIADAIFLLGHLFIGARAPDCPGIADVNASGEVDIADVIWLLSYLFGTGKEIRPLSAAELDYCRNPPVPVTVLRGGPITTIQHGVRGWVDHLSNDTILIRNFYYDGGGLPEVVVWLHLDRTRERQGMRISDDLRRETPYVNVTLEFPIPEEITGDMWGYVSIWCTSVPTNYGYARMFR